VTCDEIDAPRWPNFLFHFRPVCPTTKPILTIKGAVNRSTVTESTGLGQGPRRRSSSHRSIIVPGLEKVLGWLASLLLHRSCSYPPRKRNSWCRNYSEYSFIRKCQAGTLLLNQFRLQSWFWNIDEAWISRIRLLLS